MILSFHPCFEADTQVVLGDRELDSRHHELIQKAQAIILPQSCKRELYELCRDGPARVFPNYDIRFLYPGKTGQARLFRCLGEPHPETCSWRDVKEFKERFYRKNKAPHDFPFLLKQDRAHEAEGVHFIKDPSSLSEALARLGVKERDGFKGFVSQEFIDCSGTVLRAVLLGDRVLTYWKRPGTGDGVITTISRGALIDHKWKPEYQEKARALAAEFSIKTKLNLAAIDFLLPASKRDPEIYFLEINYFFGRRGLGGSERYYSMLFGAIQNWLREIGQEPNGVRPV